MTEPCGWCNGKGWCGMPQFTCRKCHGAGDTTPTPLPAESPRACPTGGVCGLSEDVCHCTEAPREPTPDLAALLDAYVAARDRSDFYAATAARASLDARLAALVDNPELDATDYAHPAWWRGNDRGVEAVCEIIAKVLDGDTNQHSFGSEKLTAVVARLAALVAVEQAARTFMDTARHSYACAIHPCGCGLIELRDALAARPTEGAQNG